MRAIKEEMHCDTFHAENVSQLSEKFTLAECLARIISNMQRTQPDYALIASELAHVLPFDVLGIVLLRHDGQAMRVTTCLQSSTSVNMLSAVTPPHWLVQYHQHPLVDSMFEQLVIHTQLRVNEYTNGLDGPPAQCGDALSGHHQLRATCIVPLRTEERIFGTLELGSSSPGTYASQEVSRLVNAIAQMFATAIERAQLGGNTQIQDRQRQALKDVSTALASKADVEVVLDHIAAGISQALSVSSLLLKLDQHEQRLYLAAHSSLNGEQLSSLINDAHILEDESIIGQAIRSRQPLFADDIETEERFPASRYFYTLLHMHSVLCYPLVADNIIYGVLLLCRPDASGFTPLKVDIAALFANQAAIALREGTLLESAHKRRHFQEVIERLEREVQTPLSVDEEQRLFTQVRTEVRRTFGISLSSVLKLVGNNLLTRDERSTQLFMGREQEMAEQVETVLARADILSELSRLLVQHEQATNGMRDAWFVSDLVGNCVYINPLAESLCNLRLIDIEQSGASLERLFTSLYGYVRNEGELRHYLREFVEETLRETTLQCVVSPQLLSSTSKLHQLEETGTLTKAINNADADKHYHFVRHPMYNQQGQLIAYALQVRNVTMQVLEEANKAALLSSVSHHLRTPLTTIKAAVTGLLQEDVPWSEQMRREMLEDIDMETDHLTVLINALIEMSRIEMGVLLLDKTWCSLQEIVYTAIEQVQHVLTDCSTDIEVHLPSLSIYVDYKQIERVLRNLLENAVYHSRGAEKRVVVVSAGTEGQKALPANVCIRIMYQGEHVPIEERERFFRSFDNSQHSGNGLSLAICKGIVEAHQGCIWAEDLLDGNACFAFTLPIYLTSSV